MRGKLIYHPPERDGARSGFLLCLGYLLYSRDIWDMKYGDCVNTTHDNLANNTVPLTTWTVIIFHVVAFALTWIILIVQLWLQTVYTHFMLEWIKPNFNKHQFIICMSESEKFSQEKSSISSRNFTN